MHLPYSHSYYKTLHQLILWRFSHHRDGLVGDVGQRDEVLTDIVLGCSLTGNVDDTLREGEDTMIFLRAKSSPLPHLCIHDQLSSHLSFPLLTVNVNWDRGLLQPLCKITSPAEFSWLANVIQSPLAVGQACFHLEIGW